MPPPSRALTVKQFFGRTGLLAQWHPNYEFRPGQLDMAEAVADALKDNRHLIVEAGTGTGKTLAYLVPAILSGKRIVISTGTKNLQEQLFFKDIPFLKQHLGEDLRVCYMKGRGNYACRQKIYDAEKEPILEGLEEISDFQVIRDWEKRTETGDRAEIRTLPESSSVWAKLDARRDRCTGQKCPQFERCFLTAMHQRAQESDIIIVNHHLFFADLAVKEADFAAIIPEYAAVIFDEAHEVEDVAGQYFGISVSSYQFLDLERDIFFLAQRKNQLLPELDQALGTLREKSDAFFSLFLVPEGRSSFRAHASFAEQHEKEYRDLLLILEIAGAHLQLMQDVEETAPLFRRIQDLSQKLQIWMQGNDKSFVYWIEKRGRGTFLQATPIEIANLLAQRLFDTVDSVILTSATLAVAGGFEFVENRLGLRGPRTLAVPSHFDYPAQALLYVPQHLPDPRNLAYTRAAAEEITRLLEASRGRAFVLCTSYSQMRQLHDIVSFEIPYQVLLQGTGPRTALLEEFRATPNCVLFATSSFWQGVDVQGEQLSCVIIDKLPFAVPSDPVVNARVEAIRSDGGNPFYDYQIPQAAIALKQGFGRLIRSRTDRGVLALLDNRITKQRYGQVFFDSLPEYGFTTKFDDVARFFAVP